MPKKLRKLTRLNYLLASTALLVTAAYVNGHECETSTPNTASSAPLTAMDFKVNNLFEVNEGVVDWSGSHGGIVQVPNSELQGVRFRYKATDIDRDSTSEFRYTINQPLDHSWEYLSFRQPENFYHRESVLLIAPYALSKNEWLPGDKVITDKGIRGVVAKLDGERLFITDNEDRYDQNWGEGRTINNLRSGVSFNPMDSRGQPSNNKLSTQWQGHYSNAGMTLETDTLPPLMGGKLGVSYCRPTVNRSNSHGGIGHIKNNISINNQRAVCFDPIDNGKVVEFVVERKRSAHIQDYTGGYRIWKRVEGEEWALIFSNMTLLVFDELYNAFDNGYVMGWSNSGYNEKIDFYLLGWQLRDSRPSFLP